MLLPGFALFAQDNTNNSNSMNNTTSSNTSYNVPDNIRSSFENTYNGATNVTWENVTLPVFSQYSREGVGNVKWYPAMQGYRATYIANNRVMHVYYTDRVKSYVVAGPVIESWVPEDVITKVINQYPGAYDITVMKTVVQNSAAMNNSTTMNNSAAMNNSTSTNSSAAMNSSTGMNNSTAMNDSAAMNNIIKEDVFQIRYAETMGGSLQTAYIKADGSPAAANDVFVLR